MAKKKSGIEEALEYNKNSKKKKPNKRDLSGADRDDEEEERPGIGHNGAPEDEKKKSRPASVGGVSGDRLEQLIERVERLEEEKKGLAEDIRDVYYEARSAGYEPKIMRKIIKLRKMDRQKRQEEEELTALYCSALGME